MTKTIYNPVTPLQFCLFCSAFQLWEGYFTFKTLWLEVEWFESLQDKIMSSQVCWKEALHGQGLRWSHIIMVVPFLRKVTFIVDEAFVFARHPQLSLVWTQLTICKAQSQIITARKKGVFDFPHISNNGQQIFSFLFLVIFNKIRGIRFLWRSSTLISSVWAVAWS